MDKHKAKKMRAALRKSGYKPHAMGLWAKKGGSLRPLSEAFRLMMEFKNRKK